MALETKYKAKLCKTVAECGASIHWVGVFDPQLRVFDIIMHTPYGTTYNSFLLTTAEGLNVLFETAKEPFVAEFMDRIESVIGSSGKIDYIVLNHTEPDHSGSLDALLTKYPTATVVATRAAVDNLKHITHGTAAAAALDKAIVITPGTTQKSATTLDLKSISIEFYVCPLLHWPDTMFSYLPQLKTLVTCDFFGAHYCNERVFSDTICAGDTTAEAALWDAYKYYFDCIFGPFKSYVIKGLDVVDTLDVDTICCSHGPVLRDNLPKYIAAYREWSKSAVKEDRVVITYVSAYKYTRTLANCIAKSLESSGVKATLFDLVESKLDDALASLDTAKGLLLGTPTIVGEALPPIWDVVSRLNPIIHQGLIVGVFGSYGWSGEGPRNIQARLDQLSPRLKVPLEPYVVRFKPSDKDADCAVWGTKFARVVQGEKINERKPAANVASASNRIRQFLLPSTTPLPNDGRLRRWKCIVCGEIVVGVQPPQVCRACGAGMEAFICVGLASQTQARKTDDSQGHIVVIGAGAAAISAVKAIREENSSVRVTMVSTENFRPYYRPSLSKLLADPKLMEEESFYLLPPTWLETNKVHLLLNHTVTKVEAKENKVSVTDLKSGAVHELSYTSLIVATGGTAFIPFPQELASRAQNVFSIRQLADVLKMISYIREKAPKSCVIIGGGLAALEVAQSLLDFGVSQVSMVECLPRICPKQLSEEASLVYQKAVEKRGVQLHLKVCCKELIFSTDPSAVNQMASGVLLTNLETLNADMVCFSIGTRPDIQVARESGAKVNRAIVVDEKMQTSLANIYACGDCAEFAGQNIPNWTEAIAQGRVAGMQAVGNSEEVFFRQASPYALHAFVSAFSVGDISQLNEVLTFKREDQEGNVNFMQLFFNKGQLVGSILIGKTIVGKLQTAVNAAVAANPPLSVAEAAQFAGAF